MPTSHLEVVACRYAFKGQVEGHVRKSRSEPPQCLAECGNNFPRLVSFLVLLYFNVDPNTNNGIQSSPTFKTPWRHDLKFVTVMECLYVIIHRNSNIEWPLPRSSLAFQIGCLYDSLSFKVHVELGLWDKEVKPVFNCGKASASSFLLLWMWARPGWISLCEVALIPTMVLTNF